MELGRLFLAQEMTEIDHYAITEFIQGQTRRWAPALAWSFGEMRAPDVSYAFFDCSSPSYAL